MKTPIIFKSLNKVSKQNTFRNVKRDNRARENTANDVKQNCIKLAEKYLSETARRFYSSLAGTDRDIDDEDL